MKKLLILLIGFAFTQSIQTKQVSVTIEQWDTPINLFEEMGLIGDKYKIEIVDAEILNQVTVCTSFDVNSSFLGIVGLPIMIDSDYERYVKSLNEYTIGNWAILDYDCVTFNSNQNLYHENVGISNQFPNIYLNSIYGQGNMSTDYTFYYNQFGATTLTFRVTGMFEDDAMFDTGDLNEDGAVNVVDVVVLVNSILGIG